MLIGHKKWLKKKKHKKHKEEKEQKKAKSHKGEPKPVMPIANLMPIGPTGGLQPLLPAASRAAAIGGIKGPPFPGRLLVEGMWLHLHEVETTQRSTRAAQEGNARYVPGLHCHAWRFKGQCTSGAICNYVHVIAERGRLAALSVSNPLADPLTPKRPPTVNPLIANAIYDPSRLPKKPRGLHEEKKKKKSKRKHRSRSRSRSRKKGRGGSRSRSRSRSPSPA